MLETSRICAVLAIAFVGGCAVPEPRVETPVPSPAPPVAVVPPRPPGPSDAEIAAAEEARALLAQAETDVQRARAKRALWLKAWEDLVAARQALAAKDHAKASRHARRASEFALLGLEQLAYPAIR